MTGKKPSVETQCATYLRALADPLRLQIVKALQTGAMSVSDIALRLEQPVNVVSHHLRVLYHAELVATQRDGKFIFYSLHENLTTVASGVQDNILNLGCCRIDFNQR